LRFRFHLIVADRNAHKVISAVISCLRGVDESPVGIDDCDDGAVDGGAALVYDCSCDCCCGLLSPGGFSHAQTDQKHPKGNTPQDDSLHTPLLKGLPNRLQWTTVIASPNSRMRKAICQNDS